MAADKREQMRLRFLRMSKHFNWTANSQTNTIPNTPAPADQAEQRVPRKSSTNIGDKPNDSYHSYDSEATEITESDTNMSPPPQPGDPPQTTSYLSNPGPRTDQHHTRSPLNTLNGQQTLEQNTPYPLSRPDQHTSSLPGDPLLESTMQNSKLHKSHDRSLSNDLQSSSVSLALTEENLSKFNQSFHDTSPHPHGTGKAVDALNSIDSIESKSQSNPSNRSNDAARSKSISKPPSSASSVLSKHDFTLLEISSTESEQENIPRNVAESGHRRDRRDRTGRGSLGQNGEGGVRGTDRTVRDQLDSPFITDQSAIFNEHSFTFTPINSPPFTPALASKQSSLTKTKQPPSNLRGGAFLDLCTSDEDSGDDGGGGGRGEDKNVMDDLNQSFSTILGKPFDSSFIGNTPTVNRVTANGVATNRVPSSNGLNRSNYGMSSLSDLIRTPAFDQTKRTKKYDFGTAVPTKTRTKKVFKKRKQIVQSVDVRKSKIKRNNPRILCDEILSARQYKKEKDQVPWCP